MSDHQSTESSTLHESATSESGLKHSNSASSSSRGSRRKLFTKPKGRMLHLMRRSSSPHPGPLPRRSSSDSTSARSKGHPGQPTRLPTQTSCIELDSPEDFPSFIDLSKLVLRVTVLRGRQLAAKDEEHGSFDPYVVVSCAGQRHRTEVVHTSKDPEWLNTFEIRLSGNTGRAHRRRQRLLWSQGLVLTLCNKDRFKSVFVSQIRIPAEALFADTADSFAYDSSEARWYPLQEPTMRNKRLTLRRRKNANDMTPDSTTTTAASPAADGSLGEIELRYGLAGQDDVTSDERMKALWGFLAETRPGRSLTSTDLVDETSSPSTSDTPSARVRRRRFRTKKSAKSATSADRNGARKAKKFSRMRKRFRRQRKGHIAQFHSDVLGITFLEISHANDLPPERNMTRTGFDMDPFVIVSYGPSTFRTRAIRHNLNPVWNEKLFFHVRDNEANYKLKFAVYDKDKISNNDYIAYQEVSVQDIIDRSLQSDSKDVDTESPTDVIDANMDMHTIDLQMIKTGKWHDHHPTLTFRAKFMPYTEIRRLFWVSLAKTYGVTDNGHITTLEVHSMLESLGSTITEATLNGFWAQHGKNPDSDTLSINEVVESLECFMLNTDEKMPETVSLNMMQDGNASELDIPSPESTDDGNEDEFTDAGDDEDLEEEDEEDEEDEDDEDDEEYLSFEESLPDDMDDLAVNDPSSNASEEADNEELFREAAGVQYTNGSNQIHYTEEGQPIESFDMTPSSSSDHQPSFYEKHSQEKVIRLAECPICHRPNLSKRAQMDIVTHVATCAANDWTTVDRFLMGNFVTEAYAQRRWFVKLVSKVGYGKYQIGSNNANIIVQDRNSGHLIEERMSVYVRLGMRLIYKGMKTGIQSRTAQRLLTNMTLKQGRRYDSPYSKRDIKPFIKFHQLDMSEVLEPLSSFRTFNEFFYRKLKPTARPCECPDDKNVVVSPADCRMLAFPTINDATRLWIKGNEFSLEKLLGDEILASEFYGGALAIFRLAPQDYHRFHSPVDGTISDIKHIEGQYYTVNPMAIRTTLDVYGENTRSVVSMDSDSFGKVAVVLIGAMMVGSIKLTAEKGAYLKRTDELGYFAFGGSTIVVLWQEDTLTFDRDLIENSDRMLESLVRVGNRIGQKVV